MIPPNDAFSGIEEKLKRSHENIRNLESEITAFFQKCDYPVISNEDPQVVAKAVQYHRHLAVPLRFSVLSGEIIHHLRSCLDHVVWLFSSPQYREENTRFIEFPILEKRPTKENVFTSFDRKVKGIQNPYVLDLIKRFQPYHSANPSNHILAILHKLDVIDKHRSLVIVATTGAVEIPIPLAERIARYQREVAQDLSPELKRELKPHAKIIPQVAFSEFFKGETETVVQGLTQLQNNVIHALENFTRYKP